MSNDDSRDRNAPDRQDEPTTRDRPIETRLERLDALTRALLADIQHPTGTAFEETTARTRQQARRHVLEIRAQASQLGIRVVGPDAAIAYRPDDRQAGADGD